jgi:hypothetical protein
VKLPRPQWQLPTLLLGGLVWLGLAALGEVVGPWLTSVRWLTGALLVLGLLAWVVRLWLEHRQQEPDDPGRPDEPVPLPPPPELVGRSAQLAVALGLARRHGVLLLHGPRGIGTSALALATAAGLADSGAGLGTYADLRSGEAGRPEPPHRARARVLAALGLPLEPGDDAELAAEQVAAALRDTGRVLVLDNVRDREQVAWLDRPVPGAYVLVAGDLPPWPGSVDLPVGPLDPDDGLALLRADPAVAPRVLARAESHELASRYLKFPVVVTALRSWLAANPRVGVRALLADLDGTDPETSEPSELLRTVFALHTRGVSAPARRLLALLPYVPLTWLTSAAAGALLDRPTAPAERVLVELVRSGLLERTTPSRFRVPREARALGLGDRPEERAAALTRLIGWYAGEATKQREALAGNRAGSEPDARAWFRQEADALLALLRAAGGAVRTAAPRVALLGDALDAWHARDGRLDDRRAAAAAAAAAADALGDTEGRVTALLRLAAVARAAGELGAAEGSLRLAADLAAPHDPRLAVARGQLAYALGDRAGAAAELEYNLPRRTRADVVGRVTDRLDLAAVRLARRDGPAATRLLREAWTLADDAGDAAGVAYAQELLGIAAARTDDHAGASAAWAEAQLRYEQLRDDDGRARCLQHRGTLLAVSAPEEARELLAESVRRRHGRPGLGVALAHAQLAELAGDRRERDRQRALARAALAPWGDRLEPPAEVTALLSRLDPDCIE